MLPKSLALQSAERIALWLTPPMLWIQTLLYPFVIALNGVANLVLRPFGIHHDEHQADQYYTSEELQLIVEESEEQGALRSESSQVLQELFEFGELTAGEVMVPRVRITGIPVGARPDDLREILGTAPRTRYPIYEGDLDHIVGTYHIKDLLRLLLNGQPVTAAGARPAPVVPETALLDAVLATMRRERAQFARRHRRARRHVGRRHARGSVRGSGRRDRRQPGAPVGPDARRGRAAARAGHDAARRARDSCSTSSWRTRTWTASAASS